MTTPSSLIPRLRFPEFTEQWRVSTISDVAKIGTGSKDTQDRVEGGKYPFYVRSDTIETINSFGYDGEAILTSGDGVGVGKNFHYVVGKFDYHQRVYAIREFSSGVSGRFIYYYFSDRFYRRVARLSAKNSVDSIRMEMIADMPVTIPKFAEQVKIADFLTSIDARLTLQKSKITQLKTYKKALLQKLFPKPGEALPELRFGDGEWKRVVLGDITVVLKGKGISKAETSASGSTFCVRYGELYTVYGEVINDVVSKTNINIEDLVICKPNDVLVPGSGETSLDIATASCVMVPNVAISGDTNIIRTNENGVFLAYYIRGRLKNEIASLAQGNSVVHLYASQIRTVQLHLPTVETQKKVAHFLSNLDEKIAIEERRLDELDKFKSGLLREMFV